MWNFFLINLHGTIVVNIFLDSVCICAEKRVHDWRPFKKPRNSILCFSQSHNFFSGFGTSIEKDMVVQVS